MQINRLFEMIYMLLDRNTITAKELAGHFEVSQRTIYRDVEILSAAHIPIYMRQGKGGGIGLLPEFVLNKTLLTEEEKTEILSALHGLSAADPTPSSTLLKLSSLFGSNSTNWIEIDYSDWDPMKQIQFDLLKQSVINRNTILFDYFNTNGEFSQREAEPLTLWFKSKSWYLKAFCLQKQDFRIFKLTRMKNIVRTDNHFAPRIMPADDNHKPAPSGMTKITVRFDVSQNYRIYDDFEDEIITKDPEGSFTVSFDAVSDSGLYDYILSFGCHAEVLEPESVRNNIKNLLQKSLEKYL